jgi:3',5'-cyclic AMP phosphodiesterase CpdA
MRTIVHLSDIHFGRVDPATLAPLTRAVHAAKPDLVAVSGDLTQRARTTEFLQARAFLDSLPGPQIVVPGNHDVPLHNLYARFFEGLDRFRRYIDPALEPSFADDELAVAGINTARASTWKGGRISHREIARAHDLFCSAAPGAVKIVVTHHPFELPGHIARGLVGRAGHAMRRLASCGADIFLAGHLHLGYTAHTAERYAISGHSALVVQAGTATSTRGRGEANSFNILRVTSTHVSVERRIWRPESKTFAPDPVQTYRREGRIWLAEVP